MKSLLRAVLAGLILLGMISMTGCTRHPNEKQITSLEETIKAAKSAEAQLDEKKNTREDLERQVKEWEGKLTAAQKEKAAVEARLQNMNK